MSFTSFEHCVWAHIWVLLCSWLQIATSSSSDFAISQRYSETIHRLCTQGNSFSGFLRTSELRSWPGSWHVVYWGPHWLSNQLVWKSLHRQDVQFGLYKASLRFSPCPACFTGAISRSIPVVWRLSPNQEFKCFLDPEAQVILVSLMFLTTWKSVCVPVRVPVVLIIRR